MANPIVNLSMEVFHRLDFAPSLRLAYNRSATFAVAVEHYADFGQLSHLDSRKNQEHNLFAVTDYAGKLIDVEAGIGFGLTKTSDKLVLKTIFFHTVLIASARAAPTPSFQFQFYFLVTPAPRERPFAVE